MAPYPGLVQRMGGSSFTWREDLDETLNFWFWLRREGGIGEAELTERITEWAGIHHPYSAHLVVKDHPRFDEYLRNGRAWRSAETRRHIDELRDTKARVQRAHYRGLEAIGVQIRVEWVRAPFGERWLVPPDLAVLGVDGADAEARRSAVLDAARALR